MNNEKQILVPELRFPEFENDGNWKEKTIDDIKSIVTDYVANGSFASLKENVEIRSSKDYAYYIRLTDLRAGLGHIKQKFATKKSYDFLNKSCLFGGELLMANIGANVGEVWQMPKVNYPSTLAPNMIMAKFKEKIEDEFIYYFLTSELGIKNISITISGNAHPKINKTEFKQVKVVLPENDKEQQKIANCFSSLDNLITAETEKLDHLKDHKKGLLQQLFPAKGETKPQFRFPEFEEDRDWEEKMLANIANVVASGDLDKKKFSSIKTDNHTYPIYSNSVSKEGLYGFSTFSKYNSNSVTITARGTLGAAFYRATDFVGIGRLLVISNFKEVNSIFFKENWNYYAQIHLENGGIPQLTAVKAKLTTLKYPSKEEQQKIADCLSSADDLIEAQITKIKALKAHKKGLMQKLFPNVNSLEI